MLRRLAAPGYGSFQRIATSARLDCIQRRVKAIEKVAYISQNKLV